MARKPNVRGLRRKFIRDDFDKARPKHKNELERLKEEAARRIRPLPKRKPKLAPLPKRRKRSGK